MTYKRAALVWLVQGARRREFRYTYKPGNASRTRGRAYFFYIFTQTRPTPIDYLPYFKHVTGTRHIILFGLNNNTTNALADPGGRTRRARP